MGFQALFKFVKCWRAPDIARETVPSGWGCDGDKGCNILIVLVQSTLIHSYVLCTTCR